MSKPVHIMRDELWFRPSPNLSFAVLSQFFRTRKVIATPRLGKRDETHPKGYMPGATVVLRLFDADWQEQLRKEVRVTHVRIKPLCDFEDSELKDTVYRLVESMRQDLSFFEERPVAPDEIISLVEFINLNQEKQP